MEMWNWSKNWSVNLFLTKETDYVQHNQTITALDPVAELSTAAIACKINMVNRTDEFVRRPKL